MGQVRMTFADATFAGALLVGGLAMSFAAAQEGPFGNESLHGSYAWLVEMSASADAPMPEFVNGGLVFYDGEGTYRGVSMFNNIPGEPDADGNATRNNDGRVDDPSTWFHWVGTYEVNPFGGFVWTWPAGDFDGIATRTESIDGVLTITEYPLVSRAPNSHTRGVWMFRHARIADGDTLPPAPEE